MLSYKDYRLKLFENDAQAPSPSPNPNTPVDPQTRLRDIEQAVIDILSNKFQEVRQEIRERVTNNWRSTLPWWRRVRNWWVKHWHGNPKAESQEYGLIYSGLLTKDDHKILSELRTILENEGPINLTMDAVDGMLYRLEVELRTEIGNAFRSAGQLLPVNQRPIDPPAEGSGQGASPTPGSPGGGDVRDVDDPEVIAPRSFPPENQGSATQPSPADENIESLSSRRKGDEKDPYNIVRRVNVNGREFLISKVRYKDGYPVEIWRKNVDDPDQPGLSVPRDLADEFHSPPAGNHIGDPRAISAGYTRQSMLQSRKQSDVVSTGPEKNSVATRSTTETEPDEGENEIDPDIEAIESPDDRDVRDKMAKAEEIAKKKEEKERQRRARLSKIGANVKTWGSGLDPNDPDRLSPTEQDEVNDSEKKWQKILEKMPSKDRQLFDLSGIKPELKDYILSLTKKRRAIFLAFIRGLDMSDFEAMFANWSKVYNPEMLDWISNIGHPLHPQEVGEALSKFVQDFSEKHPDKSPSAPFALILANKKMWDKFLELVASDQGAANESVFLSKKKEFLQKLKEQSIN